MVCKDSIAQMIYVHARFYLCFWDCSGALEFVVPVLVLLGINGVLMTVICICSFHACG